MNKLYSREIEMPFGRMIITSNEAAYLAHKVLGSMMFSHKLSDDVFKIHFQADFRKKLVLYRQKMLERGIYLGHHHGVPAYSSIFAEIHKNQSVSTGSSNY